MNVKWHYLERLKSWISAKIAKTGIAQFKKRIAILSAFILSIILVFSLSESAKLFWSEHWGIVVVFSSVACEIICDFGEEKSLIDRLKIFFGICLVIGLAAEIREAIKSDRKVAVLNKATIELAHQYDLSTNALAEARARLTGAESELLSVSNAAAMNRPDNFPISSVSGTAFLLVDKQDASLIAGIEHSSKPGMMLMSNPNDAIVPIQGIIIAGILTNLPEGIGIFLNFDQSNLASAGSGIVSFNNLQIVRLDLSAFSKPIGKIRVLRGSATLILNRPFNFDVSIR